MKVMAIGDQRMIAELTATLAGSGIEMVTFTETAAAMGALRQEKFDVVVVDSLLAIAAAVCHDVGERGNVPVVVMVRGTKVDWAALRSLNADGYILPGTGRSELMARLRAILRRNGWQAGTQPETASPLPQPAEGRK